MKILMVCLGNICRSPLADGLLRDKIQLNNLQIEVDSCGTSGHHLGEQPDERMMETALKYGCDLSKLRARQFIVNDFDQFDIIYVMDSSNYNNVIRLARSESDKQKVKIFLNELYPSKNMAVPDPYYGGEQGFEDVYELVAKATDIIIEKLK
jgi:protein-tyrosine phosphatase